MRAFLPYVITMPFLSVVIPTHKRPTLLQRAIRSTLRSAPDGDVEVLVVPNGLDESWKAVAEIFSKDHRVKWHHIEIGHANAARNHGLSKATGKYIRFLDDDDLLYETAAQQCIQLDMSNCEISVGGVDYLDHGGNIFRQSKPAVEWDFTAFMLRPSRINLPVALLFRRSLVQNRRWDQHRPFEQDTAWALELARDTDLVLHTYTDQVGAWHHHNENRTSKSVSLQNHNRATVQIIFDTIDGLKMRSAFSQARRIAAAQALWDCSHKSFPSSPIYWTKVLREARKLDPSSRPDESAYSRFPLKQLNPIVSEWLMAPYRHFKCWKRNVADHRPHEFPR